MKVSTTTWKRSGYQTPVSDIAAKNQKLSNTKLKKTQNTRIKLIRKIAHTYIHTFRNVRIIHLEEARYPCLSETDKCKVVKYQEDIRNIQHLVIPLYYQLFTFAALCYSNSSVLMKKPD